MRTMGALVLALNLAGCAVTESPDRTDVALIKATIRSIEPLPGDDPETLADVDLAMDNRVTVTITDVLLGRVDNRQLTLLLRMSANPAPGPSGNVYALVEQNAQGGFRTVAWDYAMRRSLCIDYTLAQQLKIEAELTRLYKSGRLPCLSGWEASE